MPTFKRHLGATALLLFLALHAGALFAKDIYGRIVSISDGDTVTLLTSEKTQVKIRLAEIDAPESGQPYGKRSKEILSDFIFGEDVQVKITDQDRYGRSVGTVFHNNININRQMVQLGAAWAYRAYLKDKTLIAVENDAKKAGVGLWGLHASQIMSPWEWRQRRRTTEQVAAKPEIRSDRKNYSCQQRKTCSQITSCEEAKFLLITCGHTAIDGNRDGVPCEKLCK